MDFFYDDFVLTCLYHNVFELFIFIHSYVSLRVTSCLTLKVHVWPGLSLSNCKVQTKQKNPKTNVDDATNPLNCILKGHILHFCSIVYLKLFEARFLKTMTVTPLLPSQALGLCKNIYTANYRNIFFHNSVSIFQLLVSILFLKTC